MSSCVALSKIVLRSLFILFTLVSVVLFIVRDGLRVLAFSIRFSRTRSRYQIVILICSIIQYYRQLSSVFSFFFFYFLQFFLLCLKSSFLCHACPLSIHVFHDFFKRCFVFHCFHSTVNSSFCLGCVAQMSGEPVAIL